MRKFVLILFVLLVQLAGYSAAHADQRTIMSGTEYETEVWVLEGEINHPAALVLGGVHGNEPAGSLAAERLCRSKVLKGTLVIVPRVNKLALASHVRTLAGIGDVNRAYPGDLSGTPAQQLAAEIVRLADTYRVSLFLDLHEGRTFHRLDKTSVGQMLLFTPTEKSLDMGLGAIDHINQVMDAPHKKYSFGAHPIKGSGAWFAARYLGIPAFTVETAGTQPLEERIHQHLIITRYLLSAGGIEVQ